MTDKPALVSKILFRKRRNGIVYQRIIIKYNDGSGEVFETRKDQVPNV